MLAHGKTAAYCGKGDRARGWAAGEGAGRVRSAQGVRWLRTLVQAHVEDGHESVLAHPETSARSGLLMEWRRVLRRMWGGNMVSIGAREVEWAVRCERGRLRTSGTAARARMGRPATGRTQSKDGSPRKDTKARAKAFCPFESRPIFRRCRPPLLRLSRACRVSQTIISLPLTTDATRVTPSGVCCVPPRRHAPRDRQRGRGSCPTPVPARISVRPSARAARVCGLWRPNPRCPTPQPPPASPVQAAARTATSWPEPACVSRLGLPRETTSRSGSALGSTPHPAQPTRRRRYRFPPARLKRRSPTHP